MKLSRINRIAAYAASGLFGLLGAMAFSASESMLGLAFILIGPTLAVLFHELGHAVAAWWLGMRVHAIVVGPAKLCFDPMRLERSDNFIGHDVGGYVAFDDGRRKYLTSKIEMLIAAAGPLANLASAIAAWNLAIVAPERVSATLLVGFSFVSIAAFIISAWPFAMVDGVANDAQRIVQILRRNRPRRAPNRAGRSPWQAP